MSIDACLTNFARRDWLTDGPFNDAVAPPLHRGVAQPALFRSHHPRLSGLSGPFQPLDQD